MKTTLLDMVILWFICWSVICRSQKHGERRSWLLEVKSLPPHIAARNSLTIGCKSNSKWSSAEATTHVSLTRRAANSLPPNGRRYHQTIIKTWHKRLKLQLLAAGRPGRLSGRSHAVVIELQMPESCEAVISRCTCRPSRSKKASSTLKSQFWHILDTLCPASSTHRVNCST